MDWNAIKTEYITDEASSYTKLSKKYGISRSTIANRAGREGWANEKERYRNEVVTKTVEKIINANASRAARLQTVADKLLNKIEKAVDALEDDSMETQQFRQIAASLKDIKDIQMIRSDADMREQEARIANLQRQSAVADDNDGKVYGVVLLPPIAEMPKPPEEASDERK